VNAKAKTSQAGKRQNTEKEKKKTKHFNCYSTMRQQEVMYRNHFPAVGSRQDKQQGEIYGGV